ncbi:serine hydrolase [Calidifontibacter sp. DB0510]|uniref:Serine hydrolase n=1 Tax=Metallococcus carri TaxID=1656884 RepID=A0A967E977_9MICO|nr:serine hydrolase [Metallococcus carri]NHN56072.1 serine hydrolase [Metallococcus carri]NOP37471.1 serine hydrolase [Calidifontibacter sp. DB2511S]
MPRRLAFACCAAVAIAGCSTPSAPPPHSTRAVTSSAPGSPSTTVRPSASPTGGVRVLPPRPPVSAAWQQLDRQAASLAPSVAVVAGQVLPDGRLQLVHRSGPTDARPLASVVKLYVLLAVADQVRSGALRWDSPLRLQDVDRAGGSGSLGGRATGSTVTVQEAARLMIHISDNTATDLLMRTVGQPALAKAVAASGHSDPTRLSPFPTIRQDLWLEWSSSPAAVAARRSWAGASPSQRAGLLRTADTSPPADLSAAVPRWQQGFGYFATATDIAVAHVLLHRASKERGLAPLRAILHNPDVAIVQPPSWRYTAYKSGAVAGVQNGSWYAETARGDQVLVVLASSPGSVSPARFTALASNAAGVLSRS